MDSPGDLQVQYVFDVSDPENYANGGNRLMESVATTISSGEVVQERWHTCDRKGNVDLVIRRIAGGEDPWHRRPASVAPLVISRRGYEELSKYSACYDNTALFRHDPENVLCTLIIVNHSPYQAS